MIFNPLLTGRVLVFVMLLLILNLPEQVYTPQIARASDDNIESSPKKDTTGSISYVNKHSFQSGTATLVGKSTTNGSMAKVSEVLQKDKPLNYRDFQSLTDRKTHQPSEIFSEKKSQRGPQFSNQGQLTASPTAGFDGLNMDQSGGFFPPNIQVATGPYHIIEMVNLEGEIWTKNGTVISTFPLSTFFLTGADNLSDPKILFDSSSQRWFASIADATTSAVKVAVSSSDNPTGSWHVYDLSFGSNCPDQPLLGINDDKVVLSANEFSDQCRGSFLGLQYVILDKSEMVEGSNIVNSQSIGPDLNLFSVHPVQSLSSTPILYMISVEDGGGINQVQLFSISGQVPNTIVSVTNLTIQAVNYPPDAPQKGTTKKLSTQDSRIQDAKWSNGKLWAVLHDACIPDGDTISRSCIHLVQISTSTPTVTQDFRYALSGQYFFYPAIVNDGNGNMNLIFGFCNSTTYPSLAVTGQAAAGPLNTLIPPIILKSGMKPDTSGRYGDYFGAAQDPSNPNLVWLGGEYHSSSLSSASWSTFVGNFNISLALLDTTIPTLNINSPVNNTTTRTTIVPVSGTSSDNVSVQSVKWKVDQGATFTATRTNNWSFTTGSLPSGLHTIWINATDIASNVVTKHIGITIDTTVPTLTVNSPDNNTSTNNLEVIVSGTASDNTSVQSVIWKVDNGEVDTATGTTNWSFKTLSQSLGTHTIYVNVTDIAGNVVSKHIGIKIIPPPDTTPPTLNVNSPANGSSTSNSIVLVSGTATDDTSVQSVIWKVDSNGPVRNATGTTNWSFTTSSLSVGNHTIFINATDSANLSTSKNVAITITLLSGPTIVTGVVFNDPNNNGKQDGAEKGIENATLIGVDLANQNPVLHATTMANGTYSFSNLTVTHTFLVQVAPVPTAHLPSNGTHSFVYIKISAGQNTVNFSLLPINASNSAKITGTVFNDTNTNGIQDLGENGLNNIQVFVVDFLTLTQKTVHTDVNGNYNVTGVLPDIVLVQVAPVPVGFLPINGTHSFVYPPLLSQGNISTVNFPLRLVQPSELMTIKATVFNDANSDGTRQVNEAGLGEVQVFSFVLLTAEQQNKFTDVHGNVTFNGVTPDVTLVQVVPPVNQTATSPPVTPTSGLGFKYFNSPQVTPGANLIETFGLH